MSGEPGRAAADRVAPVMADRRLVPAMAAVWAGAWMSTRPGLPPALLLAGAAVLLAVAGALVTWWARERRDRPGRRGAHARTPGGSLRWGIALAAVASACALLSGTAAMTAHTRDPTMRLIDQGATRLTVTAELLDDPAPVRTRWAGDRRSAEVRILTVSTVSGPGRSTGIAASLSSSSDPAASALAGSDPIADALAGSAPAAEPLPSRVRMLVQGTGWEHLARGDIVRVSGAPDVSFRSDPPFAGTLRADDPRLLSRPGGWRGAVRGVRADLVDAVRGLPDQARALVPGMAVGDDRAMPDDLGEAMRTASLTHLTAVSGSHVAILLGVVVAVVPGRGRGRALASLAVMAALVAVVGPEPSVVRSVATAGVGVGGLLTRRPGQAQAALCAVAVAILLVDPWSARSFGFVLSVLATWGVIGPAAAWSRWARESLRADTLAGRAARRTLDAAAIPIAAQILVAPVLLLLNPWLPTWGVLANIAAAPAVAPASLLGLAAAVTAPWWPDGGHALAVASGVFTGWIAGAGLTVSAWPGARLPWPGGSVGAVLLVTAGMLLASVIRMARRLGPLLSRPAGGPDPPEPSSVGELPDRTGGSGARRRTTCRWRYRPAPGAGGGTGGPPGRSAPVPGSADGDPRWSEEDWRKTWDGRVVVASDGTAHLRGGHRSGKGWVGKTEFPPSWTLEDVRRATMLAWRDPDAVSMSGDRRRARRVVDHVMVQVEAYGDDFSTFRTSFPRSGSDPSSELKCNAPGSRAAIRVDEAGARHT